MAEADIRETSDKQQIAQPDLFVSYAREDREFVERLIAALAARGKKAWVDLENIPPSAEWMDEINRAIEASAAVVVVLSPNSLASEVCTEEALGAVGMGKRIVPILYREVEGKDVPEELAKRNWIMFRETDDFDQAVGTLIEALDTDLEHVRAHTQLLTKASEWEGRGETRGLLLRGAELSEAEAWLGASGGKEPAPTAIQTSYLLASRRAASRRQRMATAAVAAVLVVSIGLSIAALIERNTAVSERNTARSRELAAAATANLPTDPQLSLLLSLQAVSASNTQEAADSLRQSIVTSHLKQTFEVGTRLFNVQFSPDGKEIATSASGKVVLWNLSTGNMVQTLDAGSAEVDGLAFSPDGKLLAAGSADHQVRIWATSTGALTQTLTLNSAFRGPMQLVQVSFNPSGKRLLTTSQDAFVRFWDPSSGRLIRTLHLPRAALYGQYSPISNDFVVTFEDHGGAVYSSSGKRLAELASPVRLWEAHFSPDGQQIATAGNDSYARVWEASTGNQLQQIPTGSNVISTNFSPDASYLVTAGLDGSAVIWNIANARVIERLTGGVGGAETVVFSADGRFVGSANTSGEADLWNVDGPISQTNLPDLWAQCWNGHSFELLNQVGTTASLHPADGGPPTATVQAPSGSDLKITGDCSAISATKGPKVEVWNLANGTPNSPELIRYDKPAYPFATFLSDDGTLVGATVGKNFEVWDATSAHLIFSTPCAAVPCLGSVSPNDRIAVVGDYKGKVAFFDLPSGHVRLQPPAFTAAVLRSAYSPDGRLVAVSSQDATIRIWNLQSGAVVAKLLAGNSAVYGMGFSDDQRYLAATLNDGSVAVFDIARHEEIWHLPTPLGTTFRSGFVPGTHDVWVMAYRAFAVYDCVICQPESALVRIAHQHLTRDFTAEERQRYGIEPPS